MTLLDDDYIRHGAVVGIEYYTGTEYENFFPKEVTHAYIIPACIGANRNVITESALCSAAGFPTIYPILQQALGDPVGSDYRLRNITVEGLNGNRAISGAGMNILDNNT